MPTAAAAAVMSDVPGSPGELERRVAELEERIGELYAGSAMASDLDVVWITVSAVLVFFMQVGFAMVSDRNCRSWNCYTAISLPYLTRALKTST